MIRICFLVVFVLLFTRSNCQDRLFKNAEFCRRPFVEDVQPTNLNKIVRCKMSLEKVPTPNAHADRVDTLLIYNCSICSITFYKTFDKIFFYEAKIMKRGVQLSMGITIGQTRESFIKALALGDLEKKDMYSITDDSEYALHRFYFKNDRLVNIELDSGVD